MSISANPDSRATPADLLAGAAIAITGGAGFIGSHLIRTLLTRNVCKIVAIDNLRCGTWDNLGDAGQDPRVELVTFDLGYDDPARLEAALSGCDFLFHLAAEKHNQSIQQPERVLKANVEGTFALFDQAAKAGLRKVVFTSSLYAYGRANLPAMREDETPHPHTVYGLSKIAGEHLCGHFRQWRQLETTVARLFFVYGPRQFAGMGYKSVIVGNFERLLRTEAPVIFGDGLQSLDYIYIDDVIEALIACLDSKANGQTVNIGSGKAVTIAELTSLMSEVAGSVISPSHAPADWTAGTVRLSDSALAHKVLGWQAKTSIRDGLTAVFEWMKARSI